MGLSHFVVSTPHPNPLPTSGERELKRLFYSKTRTRDADCSLAPRKGGEGWGEGLQTANEILTGEAFLTSRNCQHPIYHARPQTTPILNRTTWVKPRNDNREHSAIARVALASLRTPAQYSLKTSRKIWYISSICFFSATRAGAQMPESPVNLMCRPRLKRRLVAS